MTRDAAIAHAADYFDSGAYRADLTRRVAIRTESQMLADRGAEMAAYFAEMRATLEPMGYVCADYDNPVDGGGPLVWARHRRQQGPTQHQYRRFARGVGDARRTPWV